MPPSHQKRPISGSQRRQTHVIGGRPSAADRRSSRSSVYGQSAPSQVKKDPRPLSDKAYQSASIKKLISFLSERNYPKMLSPKALHTPSTKEFLHILNFMLELIDESLVVNPMNIVEEVPKVLKMLGYPFTVSKNHMLNVGSPHSWPILLGALTWLIDCCMIPDNTSELMFPRENGFGDEEQTREEREFEIVKYMYRVFMESGESSPEYQDLLQRREDAAKREYENLQQESERVKKESDVLEENIEELSKSSIPVLQAQIQQNQTEYAELVQHLNSDFMPAIHQLESECSAHDAAASEIEMQIEASKQKSRELEDQIRSQPMSASDAHELLQSIRDAEDELEKNKQMQDENNQRVAELQMQHNRSVSLIDKECRHVNDMLCRLGAVLPAAASLPTLDYNTSKRADPEVLQRLMGCAKTLRQEVQKLHQKVASEISEIESKIISGETTQSALHNEQVKKQLEIENVEHTLDIEKAALERRKQKFEEAMKAEQAEKHALEKHLMSLQQRLQAGSTTQKELASIKKQLSVCVVLVWMNVSNAPPNKTSFVHECI